MPLAEGTCIPFLKVLRVPTISLPAHCAAESCDHQYSRARTQQVPPLQKHCSLCEMLVIVRLTLLITKLNKSQKRCFVKKLVVLHRRSSFECLSIMLALSVGHTINRWSTVRIVAAREASVVVSWPGPWIQVISSNSHVGPLLIGLPLPPRLSYYILFLRAEENAKKKRKKEHCQSSFIHKYSQY